MVAKVLGNTGSPIKACEMMYKAVFQAVTLYGSEICVVTDAMMTVLEVFHQRISIYIVGMTARKGDSG